MKLKFNELQKTSLAQAVADRILGIIRDGHVNVGDKLPPERQMCQDLGVSRTSLREGISSLVHLGVLEPVAGSGVFVRMAYPDAVLKRKMAVRRMSREDIRDLVELREGLETFVAELACRHATKKDITGLEKQAERMERAAGTGTDFNREDVAFHKFLAEASHNEYVVMVLDTIIPFIKRWVETRGEIIDTSLVASIHRKITEAVRDGKPEQVRAAMEEHFRHTRSMIAVVEEKEEKNG
ncbi:MAG: FadR family transcriptional regulator [Candidatus Aminicenantes bacterium]|nr:FadR family transcriptional regulator [Candidatus Aminicenantes bacterium]